MIIRNLHPGEEFPSDLGMGFYGPHMDRDWCWAAELDRRIIAGLIACPMHGAIFMIRVAVEKGSPFMTSRALLQGALRDARSRGCVGFVTLTDVHSRVGTRLSHLCSRIGGIQLPHLMHLACGPLNKV